MRKSIGPTLPMPISVSTFVSGKQPGCRISAFTKPSFCAPPPSLPPCQVLADPNFVTSLKTYDKDNVKPAIIDRIRKEYTCNADFNPANAAKASSAAEV